MKLTYQTGTATFIQLAIVMFLVVVNNLITFIVACTEDSSECAINATFSLIFIIFAAIWFVFVSAIGYAAEDRRSGKLAYVLIAAQLLTLGAAYGFYNYPSNWFGAVSAIIVALTCLWIIILAWRLSRAKGGRIVHRSRRKRLHNTVKNHTK